MIHCKVRFISSSSLRVLAHLTAPSCRIPSYRRVSDPSGGGGGGGVDNETDDKTRHREPTRE